MTPRALSDDQIRFLKSMGWSRCGGDYWEHGEYPMQQFHDSEAIQIARQQHKKRCMEEDGK